MGARQGINFLDRAAVAVNDLPRAGDLGRGEGRAGPNFTPRTLVSLAALADAVDDEGALNSVRAGKHDQGQPRHKSGRRSKTRSPRNPAIEGRQGDAKMLGHFPAWRAVIQEFSGRCYLALRHHPLSPRHPPELPGGLQSGASAFNGQIPLHLGQTGHDMKEKPSRGCPGIDGAGQAFELNLPSLRSFSEGDGTEIRSRRHCRNRPPARRRRGRFSQP